MAPVRLDIPKADVDVFKSFGELGDTDAENFLTALGRLGSPGSTEIAIDAISESTSIDRAVVSKLISALSNAYAALVHEREVDQDPVSPIVDDLAPKINDDDILKAIRSRLEKALSMHATLGVIAKSRSLRFGYNQHYVSSRIITDLRPVFAEDESRGMVAGVVVHQFDLRVHGTRMEEYTLTMTEANLNHLKAQIEDAIRKQRQIESTFGPNLRIVED